MVKFIPVRADAQAGKFENYEYLPRVLELWLKYKNYLLDDHYPLDRVTLVHDLIGVINSLYPHFYAVTVRRAFAGFVYLDDFRGADGAPYSCSVTVCLAPKFWGRDARMAGKAFMDLVFSGLGLSKLRAEAFEHNHRVRGLLLGLGFVQEGLLRNETLKNGVPINIVQYGLCKNSYKENINGQKEKELKYS